MLTIASLLSILFGTFHLADDINRGMSPGGLPNLFAVVICVVWLYVLAERRSEYIIMLLGSLFSLVVPVVHMKGKGVGVTSSIGNSSGHFFFVWTLIAIGVTGLFSAILSARGLWILPWRRSIGQLTRTWKSPPQGVGDLRGSAEIVCFVSAVN